MADTKDQKTQSEKFVEKAKELGVDESGKAFERAIEKIIRHPPASPKDSEPKNPNAS